MPTKDLILKENGVYAQKHETDMNYIRGINSYFNHIMDIGGEHDRVPYYPLYYNQFFNRKLPVVIDINNLMLVYQTVGPLRVIIDKKGEMLKNGKFRIFKRAKNPKDKDEEIFKHPLIDLMRKPNELPGGFKEFLSSWSRYRDIYGTCFIRKIAATHLSFPVDLKCYPAGEMILKPTGKLFNQLHLTEMIECYEWMNAIEPEAGIRKLYPYEVMLYVDGAADRYLTGTSKILSNKESVSTVNLAQKTSNSILARQGPKGIFSNEGRDQSGIFPIDNSDLKKIERQFNNDYGIDDSQMQFIVTNAAVRFQAVTSPRKELMIEESKEDAFCDLCNAYAMHRKLFADTGSSAAREPIGGDGKGKIEEAMKIVYETTITTAGEEFCDGFNIDPQFGLYQNDMYCCLTFDHLSVVQDEKLDKAQEKSYLASGASQSTSAIIELNNAVKTGAMERDAAIQILILVHGMDIEHASKIILEPKAEPEQISAEPPTDDEKEFAKITLDSWHRSKKLNNHILNITL